MDHTTDERLDREPGREASGGLDTDVPTGTTDLRGSALPELDPLAEGNEIQGHVAVPVDDTPTPVAADWGETLVRQSLSDLENRLTADRHLDHGREYEAEAPETAEAGPFRGR